MEKSNKTNNAMVSTRFNVEFRRRNITPSGKKEIERVLAEFNWNGTIEQVINRAKALVRPLVGGGDFDGDYDKVVSFDSIYIQEEGGGFIIWYDVQYLDEIRNKFLVEQIVIEGIEM